MRKKHSQQTILYFRMYLYFQRTCFIGQHFMTKCFGCKCTPMMDSQIGMYIHLKKHMRTVQLETASIHTFDLDTLNRT